MSKGDNYPTLRLSMYEHMVMCVAMSRMNDKAKRRREDGEAFDPSDLEFTRFEFDVLQQAIARAMG